MMKMKYVIPVLFCFLLAGCIPAFFLGGAAAGIAGYKFYEGSLHVIYEAPYMETWDATLRALEGMNLQVRSKKLEERSKRMIMILTGVDYKDAEFYLKKAGGKVKTAIVMILAQVNKKEAEKRLKESRGFVREALRKR